MDQTDLTELLRSWPYEAGRVNARRILGRDGLDKLQIRIDLGVLQMELDGRPDGRRFHGFASLLEYHQDSLRRYARQAGRQEGFVLSSDECRQLREEAVQYYHRYMGLMALGEYAAVVRDTTRNLALFDLCREFAATEQDREMLEQFRPYVLMVRARARAEAAVAEGQTRAAIQAIDGGLDEIRAVLDQAGQGTAFDTSNEVQLLRGMREALIPKLPVSQRMELQERLRAAIDAENYELAALLRDELRLLKE